jgi:branched-chain amino acid transport system permease protein
MSLQFWLGVGILAGVYGIFTLGLQLNLGFTGLANFGQVGFMAVGAYAMGIFLVEANLPLAVALVLALLVAGLVGLVISVPTLRLRTDYFAIVTVAAAEIIRFLAQNLRGLTGGPQGILGFNDAILTVADKFNAWFHTDFDFQFPLFLITWFIYILLALVLWWLTRSPWGRVLRAVREDEDAARALGKNAFSYKVQSLVLAALLAAVAGGLLAYQLAFLVPTEFDTIFTFIGYTGLFLGGLGSFRGVVFGTTTIWLILEGSRFLDLPLSADRVAALRYIVIGSVLVLLVMFRPQGVLGKREEMVLSE